MPLSPEEESQSKPMHLVGDLEGAAAEETVTAVSSCCVSPDAVSGVQPGGLETPAPHPPSLPAFLLPERLYHLVGPERVWEVRRKPHVGVGHRQTHRQWDGQRKLKKPNGARTTVHGEEQKTGVRTTQVKEKKRQNTSGWG